MGERVLIVKTGYSELLELGNSDTVSLGDIFRVTPLLEVYKKRGDHVTWLTDKYAFPLLEGNSSINELLHLDFPTSIHLQDRAFDTIVNLEKNKEVCGLVKRLDAWRKLGFRVDVETGDVRAYDRANEALTVSSNQDIKKTNNKTFQELLFTIAGEVWQGENYSLGYSPKSEEVFDVGLNTTVGKKWPNKAWESGKWDDLEKRLISEGFNVTRQDRQDPMIFKSINTYIDWINQSKTIVTGDTFGMHVAIALGKNVLGLFGPTPSAEVHFYDRGEAILPEPLPECLPCFRNECDYFKGPCINLIDVDRVYQKTIEYSKKGRAIKN